VERVKGSKMKSWTAKYASVPYIYPKIVSNETIQRKKECVCFETKVKQRPGLKREKGRKDVWPKRMDRATANISRVTSNNVLIERILF
jgi:hypothetical protein